MDPALAQALGAVSGALVMVLAAVASWIRAKAASERRNRRRHGDSNPDDEEDDDE